MSIVSNALAFQSCEAPGAAAEAPQRKDKSCSAKGERFEDKLHDYEKSLSKADPEGKADGAADIDNGMHDSPETAVYGIVGILEGFEPPGYQTDNTAIITGETAPSQGASAPQQIDREQPYMVNAARQDDNSQLPEQIAWTLNTQEAGMEPAKTQDQVLQIVGDYLDSLENTNKAAVTSDDIEAAAGGNSGITPVADAVSDHGTTAKKAAVVSESVSPDNPETVTGQAQADKPEAEGAAVKKTANYADINEKQLSGLETQASVARTAETRSEAPADTAEPEVAKPESARESILRIVDKVSTKAAEGKYDFDVDLKPDFMGKVSIKLTMEDGAVKVQIRADESAARMLSDQTNSLHSLLKEKGVTVSNIDVMYNGSSTQGSEGQERHADARQQQRSLFHEPSAESGAFESARERYDFYLGNSNIEYLA